MYIRQKRCSNSRRMRNPNRHCPLRDVDGRRGCHLAKRAHGQRPGGLGFSCAWSARHNRPAGAVVRLGQRRRRQTATPPPPPSGPPGQAISPGGLICGMFARAWSGGDMPTGNAQLATYRSARQPGPAAVAPPGSIRGPFFRSFSGLKFDSRGGWAGVARAPAGMAPRAPRRQLVWRVVRTSPPPLAPTWGGTS
jgi:hypothetical protein